MISSEDTASNFVPLFVTATVTAILMVVSEYMARKYKPVTSTTLQPGTTNPLSFLSLNLVLAVPWILWGIAEYVWQQIQGAPVGMLINMLGLHYNGTLLGLVLANPKARKHVRRRVGRWCREEAAGWEVEVQRGRGGGGGTVHPVGVKVAWEETAV